MPDPSLRSPSAALFVSLILGVLTWTQRCCEASGPLSQQQTDSKTQVWKQPVTPQPSVSTDDDPDSASGTVPTISAADVQRGPLPKWIWGPSHQQNYCLSIRFPVGTVRSARLMASCDNSGTVFINGRQVAESSEWQEPMSADVTAVLKLGQENLIEVEAGNAGGVAAMLLKLVWKDQQDQWNFLISDESWKVSRRRGDPDMGTANSQGSLGDGPWGNVFDVDDRASRIPSGTFLLQSGFAVEKLFTVPRDELGSWVCLAFDNRGRLLASDQGDLGICRITLPSPTISDSSAVDAGTNPMAETLVERLDFSRCAIQPSGAQGMLWAFDSLYLSINGGPGSGLYRARDLDGDDQFDECVLLKEFRGGGEHGPHSLRLSPDGSRIYVICGNHTQPPFGPGEERTHEEFRSRVPTNWAEDQLLPRMWDANGHARGVLAPGGWIASTDPDGKSWEIFSMGFRNPYDMAFNADGELFAYDADMEWDMGMPWYRPTRVVHAVSGGDFGWRSGSGKWPSHYVDSLPALVDIGPGSPVGVEFGYGLRFPAEWQQALYICDWTFGTMYSVHMTPQGSSYRATKQEFLSRTPLPLTDVVAGPDGLLYFSIGGRGTRSELFRVRYTGQASVEPVSCANTTGEASRAARRQLESLHGAPTSLNDLTSIWSSLAGQNASDDRFLRYAATLAAAHVPAEELCVAVRHRASEWSEQVDEGWVADSLSLIQALSRASQATRGLSGKHEPPVEDVDSLQASLELLLKIRPGQLSAAGKLQYLRTLSLVLIRLGEPDETGRRIFTDRIDPLFPSGDSVLDRELGQVLVALQSPTAIEKIVELLKQPAVPTADDSLRELLTRNRGYGNAISRMLSNAPDQQQIWMAFILRNGIKGWTPEQREAYFGWFGQARTWAGGSSYQGFLKNMDREAFENASENERILIEASGARERFTLPELPQPEGPGRNWSLQEVRALAETKLTQRDFDRGRKMFAATRCILCHRFAGDGGATGPDLTQLASRFNIADLTEAIIDPSKVISDQYRGTTVVLTSGRVVQGRIVSETPSQITVLADPEDSTKIVEIQKTDIEEMQPSRTSLMPQELLKTLNEDEVLDLLAYLLSRGDSRHPMFGLKK